MKVLKTIYTDPDLWKQFKETCFHARITMSACLRTLISDYIKKANKKGGPMV